VYGGKVASANLDAIKAMPGCEARVRRRGRLAILAALVGGVAIVADSWWQAQIGASKLQVTWMKAHRVAEQRGFAKRAQELSPQAPETKTACRRRCGQGARQNPA
jgi:isoquinoline 1-oxidoreductase beta subunit